mmetsp:Transcript_48552/g.113678  ORF Transcript_48552/g.113678 Transcript_48552/m.113678 type:complete len:719 (-) Transcript_48552:34-2190(-)
MQAGRDAGKGIQAQRKGVALSRVSPFESFKVGAVHHSDAKSGRDISAISRPKPTRSPAAPTALPAQEVAPMTPSSRLEKDFPSLYTKPPAHAREHPALASLTAAACTGTPRMHRANLSLELLRQQVSDVGDMLPKEHPPRAEQNASLRILDAGKPAWQPLGKSPLAQSQPLLKPASLTANLQRSSAYETLSGETSYYPIVRSTLIQQWYGESDPRARSPRNRATHKRPILHVSTRSESKTLRTSSAMTSTRPSASSSSKNGSQWPPKQSAGRDVQLEMASSNTGKGKARPLKDVTCGGIDKVGEVIEAASSSPMPQQKPAGDELPRYTAFADRCLRAREGYAVGKTLRQVQGGDEVHDRGCRCEMCVPRDVPFHQPAAGVPTQQLQEHKGPPLSHTVLQDTADDNVFITNPRTDPTVPLQRSKCRRGTTIEVLGDAPPSEQPRGKADEVRAAAGVRGRPASFSPRAGHGWKLISDVPPWTLDNRDGQHPRDVVSLQGQETQRWLVRTFSAAYTEPTAKCIIHPDASNLSERPVGDDDGGSHRARGECADGFTAFTAKCRQRLFPEQYRYAEYPSFRLATWERTQRSASAPPAACARSDGAMPEHAHHESRKAGMSSADLSRSPLGSMHAGTESQTPRRRLRDAAQEGEIADVLQQGGPQKARLEHARRYEAEKGFRELCLCTDRLQMERMQHYKRTASSRDNATSDSVRECMQWVASN